MPYTSWTVTFNTDYRSNNIIQHRRSGIRLRPYKTIPIPVLFHDVLARLQGNQGTLPDSPLGNWAEHLFEAYQNGVSFAESQSIDGTLVPLTGGLPHRFWRWGVGFDETYEMKCSKGTFTQPAPFWAKRLEYTFSAANVQNVVRTRGNFIVVHYNQLNDRFYYYKIPWHQMFVIRGRRRGRPRRIRRPQAFYAHRPDVTMSDPVRRSRSMLPGDFIPTRITFARGA